MNDAATKYEAKGGSPIVGEGLRVGLTGRNRVAYERARMERLSLEFPSFYAQRLSQINNTQDPNCLLYTSPSPRDYAASRMPSSA